VTRRLPQRAGLPNVPPHPGLEQALQSLAAPQQQLRTRAAQQVPPHLETTRVPPAHFIVVLGVPTPDASPLAPALQNRVDLAADLAKIYPEARIICSGAAVKSNVCEAIAMKSGLERLGIEANRIFCEKTSRDTIGNARESFNIIKAMVPHGACRLTLVIEPFQALRALRAFMVVRDYWDAASGCAIKMVPAKHLPYAQSSIYIYTFPSGRLPRNHGWTSALDSALLRSLLSSETSKSEVFQETKRRIQTAVDTRASLERHIKNKAAACAAMYRIGSGKPFPSKRKYYGRGWTSSMYVALLKASEPSSCTRQDVVEQSKDVLDKVIDARLKFERNLSEKIKIMWNY
jgi:hypothetical protein